MEHAKSLLPAGKKWKLVWNDEFDGTELDMTKWSFSYHILQKRQMCLSDETAALDGKGNLVLSLMEKGLLYTDSFLPVRQWKEKEKSKKASAKQ